jgi:plastocyanin domain-containing protein
VTGFREPGLYKLWLQFQRQGRIITVPWTIQVEPSDKRAPQVNPPTATASVIVSSKGFEPARLTIPANQKTQVAFTRIDAQNCASEVVFPQLGIRKPLPPGQTVPVHLPPTSSGELRFACGMGMYKGALLVQ